MDAASQALVELGRALKSENYDFVTITPESMRRVVQRRSRGSANGRGLRDIFGWNLWFEASALNPNLQQLLVTAGAVTKDGQLWRSKVRFATCSGRIFVHSAAPTDDLDSVFFGPDTYRFCSLLERYAPRAKRLVDVGCGSGAGGVLAAHGAEALVLADVNGNALRFARVNAILNDVNAEFVNSDVLTAVTGPIDAVIANPPYLRDEAHRLYRDGGGGYGEALSVRIVREALARLEPRGTLVLYTGSAIIDGRDTFFSQVRPLLSERAAHYRYFELDPDVFGEELELPAYDGADRIAVVALCARVA